MESDGSGARAISRQPLRKARSISDGLICRTLHPTVRGDGILPEVFLGGRPSFAGEILAHYAQLLRVGQPLIAVRPVTAVEQAILAENAEQLIEPGTVEIERLGDSHIHAAPHF